MLDLCDHPDEKCVQYLCEEFNSGFDIMISTTRLETLECRNVLSARTQREIVDKLVKSELEEGFLTGPLKEICLPTSE